MTTFKSGQHPITGEKALRTTVYEAVKLFPNVRFSPTEISSLLPQYDTAAVGSALRGLAKNPEAYPGVHRLGRGHYIFDLSKKQQWMTFPDMARQKKVGKTVIPVNRKKKAEHPVAQVDAVTTAERIMDDSRNMAQNAPVSLSDGLGGFVEVLPVFDSSSGRIVPMGDAVLLRDKSGEFWHATKINADVRS